MYSDAFCGKILVIKILGKQSNIGYFLELRILLVEEFI